MTKERTSPYQVLVYIAYGFYLLLSGAWFFMGLFNGHKFNPLAFFVMVVFGVQAYYRHLLTNLIVGILLFFISIIGLLESMSGLRHGDVLLIDKILIAIPAISIAMSGILIFSYLNLNFKKQ